MKIYLSILFGVLSMTLVAQSTIQGHVTDQAGLPIIGANVYLKGTYDGGSTNDTGEFSFKTEAQGIQTLVISYLSFETFTLVDEVTKMNKLLISLRDEVNSLDAVVLSAGSFSAGDNSKISVLKPLDVVTTASALGDFVGALQTLPGTTTVAEDGRLFVRGGDAEETQIFIDGLRVFTPYSPTTNNVPTRGRYSPFLFDGITFSTGGYSAEYGQALSSVLLLNTINEPDQDKTDIGMMSVGATLGNTQKWERSSLSVNASYINLAPYIALFPDRNEWEKPFEVLAGEAVFRRKFDNGLLKLYSAFDASNFELTQEDINSEDGVHFKLNNKNLYFNGSYLGMLNDTWTIFGGLSYTHGRTKVGLSTNAIDDTENSFHAKLKLKKRFSSRFKLNTGIEYFATDFEEDFSNEFVSAETYAFDNNILGSFAEADIFFSKNMALKAGIRAEYLQIFEDFALSPRLSFAYKTGSNSQFSLAYGTFNQNPTNDILKFEEDLDKQRTAHYIFNYQYNKNGQIFRAETYYKDYDNLITFDSEFADFDSEYSNEGYGYAAGVDFFWRDNRSIKNLDYWVSYSFLDTQRKYKNYPKQSQPDFINKHNISIVGKYWVDAWKSQIGFSYGYATGRTYTNPNTDGFLDQKTKPFNSLSLNWAYLISPQKILYFSVNNALNFKNINGYQYADSPDLNGQFQRRALQPAADQFFFVGFFWTISEDKSSNQLDNL
ncbi:MAG: TonB-dependent receptor [Flavobacteriaceae bacterium]|nr:TonB-dependent receptor [Flavobacteriaceae bacterium]